MLRRTYALLLLSVSLSLLAGCATEDLAGDVRRYVPPRAVLGGLRAELLEAIDAGIQARGLRVLRRDEARGTVVAVSALQPMEGMLAREHWRFFAEDAQVRVELHPQTRAEGERWVRTEFVCECYRYAREEQMLGVIRAHLARAQRRALGLRG